MFIPGAFKAGLAAQIFFSESLVEEILSSLGVSSKAEGWKEGASAGCNPPCTVALKAGQVASPNLFQQRMSTSSV